MNIAMTHPIGSGCRFKTSEGKDDFEKCPDSAKSTLKMLISVAFALLLTDDKNSDDESFFIQT